MFVARDLDSKASLRATDYPAYIVAHKQIITDRAELSALIDSNIAFIHRKERELLDDLTDGMTFSDWIYTFCQRENIRTRQELKFSIVERNFTNFTDWLTDTGKVRVQRDFCAKTLLPRLRYRVRIEKATPIGVAFPLCLFVKGHAEHLPELPVLAVGHHGGVPRAERKAGAAVRPLQHRHCPPVVERHRQLGGEPSRRLRRRSLWRWSASFCRAGRSALAAVYVSPP